MTPGPLRIVSLVPSLTELLSYLGLDDEIVGITKFCIHPNYLYRIRPRVGGTKSVDVEAVRKLRPDLILANKEENVKDQIDELSQDFMVHLTEVRDLRTSLQMIREIGALTHSRQKATQLSTAIESAFDSIQHPSLKRTCLFLIWQDPWMSIGRDTYIHDMLEKCGLQNIMAAETRYPTVVLEELECPDVVLLSSEPFPFREKHMASIRDVWPNSDIRLVDGEYFSWYGSRALKAPQYFQESGLLL